MTDTYADEPQLPPRRGTYRLGVFGGMMDPPHLGHVRAVEAAIAALGLDRVIVVPAGRPPHRDAPATPARIRLDLAIRAFADLDHVAVSDTEIERAEEGDVGYMVDTLDELAHLPAELGYDDLDVELTLLIGADQLAAFDTWNRWERILELASLGVFLRPDGPDPQEIDAHIARLGAVPGSIVVIPLAQDISSTQIRALVRAGGDGLEELVPFDILDDVEQLYR